MSNPPKEVERPPEVRSFVKTTVVSANEVHDTELDDLIFSWRRLTDPKLRQVAVAIIRAMATCK